MKFTDAAVDAIVNDAQKWDPECSPPWWPDGGAHAAVRHMLEVAEPHLAPGGLKHVRDRCPAALSMGQCILPPGHNPVFGSLPHIMEDGNLFSTEGPETASVPSEYDLMERFWQAAWPDSRTACSEECGNCKQCVTSWAISWSLTAMSNPDLVAKAETDGAWAWTKGPALPILDQLTIIHTLQLHWWDEDEHPCSCGFDFIAAGQGFKQHLGGVLAKLVKPVPATVPTILVDNHPMPVAHRPHGWRQMDDFRHRWIVTPDGWLEMPPLPLTLDMDALVTMLGTKVFHCLDNEEFGLSAKHAVAVADAVMTLARLVPTRDAFATYLRDTVQTLDKDEEWHLADGILALFHARGVFGL